MRTRQLDFYDYRNSDNPPVLHRKENFPVPGHPLFAKFWRLTQQEERHGLLEISSTTGTRAGWQICLTESVFRLTGHRLVSAKQT